MTFIVFQVYNTFQKQSNLTMGCMQDRQKKQTRDSRQMAHPNDYGKTVSRNAIQGNRENGNYSQRGGVEQKRRKQFASVPPPGDHSASPIRQSEDDIIKKYTINVKQNAYKTPNIHAYQYQRLICLNPTLQIQSTERDGIDKTFGVFGKQFTGHSKLLLTKK